MKIISTSFLLVLTITFLGAQGTYYVNPAASSNAGADGSMARPYATIATAVERRKNNGGGTVMVLGGTYDMDGTVRINTRANSATRVTIKPETGETVTFNFSGRTGFIFTDNARYITLEGFELDGNTDETEFWEIVARDFWSINGNPSGGGLAVLLDGEHLTIKDNYIHDFYQKGVEIRDGRYVTISGNIVQRIGHTSLSGGHGIMRQQKGREFFDDDSNNFYRWDIRENMVINVEQHIYSWVPSKGKIKMVLDEGKSILIDDPKDTDGNQERMKARIKNNVVAFGGIDHIRLKSTPGLEVSNNSIYSQAANGDGITDKEGDTNTPQFTNFIARNNAVQTLASVNGMELTQAVAQAGNAAVITGNYVMNGRILPQNQAGVTQQTGAALFVAPNSGNFRINPTLNLPASTGVAPAVLTELDAKAISFGTSFGASGWTVDHLKLTQTILDNIPGLNDGVEGNETVLKNAGQMNAAYDNINFRVLNGNWKTARDSPNRQDFELNPAYTDWYASIATEYLNTSGEEYARIRYGGSYLRQDLVFPEDWLTVSNISSAGETLLDGNQHNFILGGDLLIDFNDFVPPAGASYDLMVAGTIAPSTPEALFDRVLFRGFTPPAYSLEVVDVPQGQAVRFTVEAALPVGLRYFRGSVVGKGKHRLVWETSAEYNSNFFEIQRMVANRGWRMIATVPAANLAGGNFYEYTDSNPEQGTNHYRLRPIDTDGAFTFSHIVTLDFQGETGVAYPNPFGDWFSVPGTEELSCLRVFTPEGRDVSAVVSCAVQQGRVVVDARHLPAGPYLVRFNGQVNLMMKK